MGAQRAREERHAALRLRPRRPAGRRGDDDPGHLPVTPSVVLYHAQGCHLCERARAVLVAVREEVKFDLHEVDIGDDPELESRYREWLPVVEIDGRQAFTYYVHPDALRRRLTAQTSPPPDGL